MKTNMLKSSIIAISLLFLSACSQIQEQNKTASSLKTPVTSLQLDQDTLVFPLDSVTAPYTRILQVLGGDTLAFLNAADDNCILYYSISQEKFLKKRCFDKEKFGAVNYFTYTPSGDLWLCVKRSKFLKISDSDEIFKSLEYKVGDEHQAFSAFSSPIYRKEKLLLSHIIPGGYDKPIYDILDIKNGEKSPSEEVTFPKSYHNQILAFSPFENVSHTPTHLPNKILISFPGEHDLFLFDLKTRELERIERGSSNNVSLTPSKFETIEQLLALDGRTLAAHFRAYDMYKSIIYDPIAKCYYRFYTKALAKGADINDFSTPNETGIVVLDTDFNKIAEVKPHIPQISYDSFFRHPEKGVFFQNITKAREDEDNLYFNRIQFTQK